jgi:hypothetical protein
MIDDISRVSSDFVSSLCGIIQDLLQPNAAQSNDAAANLSVITACVGIFVSILF